MINLKAPSPIEREEAERTVTERVRSILDRVSRDGERALSELNHQLDDYEGPILIREKALNMALAQMDKPLRQAVEIAVDHVRSFHRAQRKLFQDQEWEISEGIKAGMRFLPVKSAGVYVPGGRYPLVSTAVMGVVPAQEAGVSRIIVFSPPRGSCGISVLTPNSLNIICGFVPAFVMSATLAMKISCCPVQRLALKSEAAIFLLSSDAST